MFNPQISKFVFLKILIASAILYSPVAQACRYGFSTLTFPAIPAETYHADFIATVEMIGGKRERDDGDTYVKFKILDSTTHPDLIGKVASGDYRTDSCGPIISKNEQGIFIGIYDTTGLSSEPRISLFKMYAFSSISTNEGNYPLIYENDPGWESWSANRN